MSGPVKRFDSLYHESYTPFGYNLLTIRPFFVTAVPWFIVRSWLAMLPSSESPCSHCPRGFNVLVYRAASPRTPHCGDGEFLAMRSTGHGGQGQ